MVELAAEIDDLHFVSFDPLVIASVAKQSSFLRAARLDCFVAPLLAMTVGACPPGRPDARRNGGTAPLRLVRNGAMLSDRGNNDASKRARRCWISLRCRSRKRTGRLPNAGSRRLTRRCGTARKRRCPGALRLTAIGGTCSASPGILPPLADGTRSFANCWPVHVMPAPPDSGSTRPCWRHGARSSPGAR